MSSPAITGSSSEVHLPPVQQSVPVSPRDDSSTDELTSENFTGQQIRSFRDDDAEAGRTICRILCILFTVSVILSGIVCLWTFS